MLDRYHFLTFGLIIARAIAVLEDPARMHAVVQDGRIAVDRGL